MVPTENFYVEPPDIPAGMTFKQYQRQRPPVRRVWIVATFATAIAGVRGILFYKNTNWEG